MYSQIQEGAGEPGTAEAATPPGSVAGDSAPDAEAAATVEAPPAEEAAPAVARRLTPLESFKSEIARAMQVAADLERERIEAGVAEEGTAQVEKVYTRAAAEAAELSKHADEDVNRVNAWYKDEVKRIRSEADRQIEDRRSGLEQSLTYHGSLIEAEIESVQLAVEGYRNSLGEFFGRLGEERDPSAIARLAGTLPDPPDLDEIRAEARSVAMEALEQESAGETPEPPDEGSGNGTNGRTGSERELVPVMDEGAIKERAGSRNSTTIAVAASDPAEPSAAEPMSRPVRSDLETTASPPDAVSSQGNVAVRVIRAFTHRSSATGASQHR
jgi:hypothetical protein